MDNKLYKLMNWPEIESIVYSECDHPEEVLGAHIVNPGTLVQAFFPGALKVTLNNFLSQSQTLMERVDEEGFFACLVPVKSPFGYDYSVEYEDGRIEKHEEVYKFVPKFWGNLDERLCAGTFYDSYRYFGAHFCERKGVLGTEFLTYAPNAARVSVVGDFNHWDGRINPMIRLTDSGVFGLFIPSILIGSLYKFEIKLSSSLTFLKRDPYAFSIEGGRGDASVVSADLGFDNNSCRREPVSNHFCMLNLSLMDYFENGKNCESAAKEIIDSMQRMGYDSILIDDLTKCSTKDVCINDTVSFFATNPSGFSNQEIIKIISILHNEGYPVYGSLDFSCFIPDNGGLIGFDGSGLFEGDAVKVDEKLSFDFNKPFVHGFLLSLCDYYVKVFSFDGLLVGGIDRILYLDYGKENGDFRPNIYGGNENIKGFEFLKDLNAYMHKYYPNIVMIASDSMASNFLTLPIDASGLGFDIKIHTQFEYDLVKYMKQPVELRPCHYSELTYSPVYIYCEKFVLPLLCKDFGCDESKLLKTFPGNSEDLYKNLRLMVSYMFMHPGRKCLSFSKTNDAKFAELVNKLISMYSTMPALFSNDDNPDSFEWVNAIDSQNSVVAFVRKCEGNELLVVANFSDKLLSYELGVDKGSYKEIFASEQIKFGGNVKLSGKVRLTVSKKVDGKADCFTMKLQPFCLHIYEKSPCQKTT